MIQDLHAHTNYSFDSPDEPKKVIETAIAGGITMLGICDHNYGVGLARRELCYNRGTDLSVDYDRTLRYYYEHITLLKEKYEKKIKIMRGIEVATAIGKHNFALPDSADVSFFDFCLVESLDKVNVSIAKGDIFSFAKRCGCPTGIAHTDLFKYISDIGESPYRYFKKMAENGIFWEINVNLDSSHEFKPHGYVSEFFKNKDQQEIIKKTGVKLSVGFDSHIISEYKPSRVHNACSLIKNMGIKLMFENL
ncbi:MAG: PHP domain-containing protein [Clostridia bacterium]|nr:PHP domain-containing protein [Clostridia bacterium]